MSRTAVQPSIIAVPHGCRDVVVVVGAVAVRIIASPPARPLRGAHGTRPATIAITHRAAAVPALPASTGIGLPRAARDIARRVRALRRAPLRASGSNYGIRSVFGRG